MSPIGKLFVVLNLVFSLVILGVLAGILAKSEEYRTMFDEEVKVHTADNEKADQDRSNLNAEIAGLKTDKIQMQEQIEALRLTNNTMKSENDSLKQDNQQLRNDVTKLQADYQKFTSALVEVQNHNKQLIARNEQLTQERNDAADERRAAVDERTRLEQQVDTLTKQVNAMADDIKGLEGRNGDLTAQIEAAIQSGFDISKVRAQPQIDAVVQSVNSEYGLVVLSVGADDGVTRGTAFEIFSPGAGYKGKVIIDDVYPDNCAGRVVLGSGIAVMDKATTRL